MTMPGSDQVGLLAGGVGLGELQQAAAAGGCCGLLATAAAAGCGGRAAAAAVKSRCSPGLGLPALAQTVPCHSWHQLVYPVH